MSLINLAESLDEKSKKGIIEGYIELYDDAKPLHQWMKDLFGVVKSVSIKDSLRKRFILHIGI